MKTLNIKEQKEIDAGASCPKRYLDAAYVRLLSGGKTKNHK